METTASNLPLGQNESIADDLKGMGSFLIDPAGAARRVHRKWFWVGPLIVFAVISFLASYLTMPIVQHAIETSPIPEGTPPEQYAKGIQVALMFQRIGMYFSPVLAAVIFAVEALILFGASAVMSVKARFRELFNLVAGCNLIQTISALAIVLILRAKGEVSSTAELRPALGLDILLPQGTNKFLTAVLAYFSVFEIWWIVMMVLIFSIAFRTSKGKAFAAVAPLMLIGILLRVIGSLSQR